MFKSNVMLLLMIFVSITMSGSVSDGNLLGNIYLCAPSAEYVLHECHTIYEKERYEFGGDYCCIYAKFRDCLREKMAISCRRSIQQLVDAKIGLSRPRDCLGIYYPSATCWLFYNAMIIAGIVGLILVGFFCFCVFCCYRCFTRMYPPKIEK